MQDATCRVGHLVKFVDATYTAVGEHKGTTGYKSVRSTAEKLSVLAFREQAVSNQDLLSHTLSNRPPTILSQMYIHLLVRSYARTNQTISILQRSSISNNGAYL